MLLQVVLWVLGVLAIAGGVPGAARADVPVWIDCYLPEVVPECREVRQAFGAAVPGVTVTETTPQIAVDLRVQEEAVGRLFFADFSGRPNGTGIRDRISFTLTERIPHAAGSERTLLLLVVLLQKGIVPFLRVDAPGQVTGGRFRLDVYADGDDTPAVPSSAPGWYVRPAFTGDITQAGLQRISLTGELEANYSLPLWRFRLVSELIWERWDFQIPDGRLAGSFFRGESKFHVVRSIGKGFSFAINGAVSRHPQNNLDVRYEAGYGVEWALAPFVRAGEANVGARVSALATHDRYVTPNLEDRAERTALRPGFTPFVRIHFERVDIESSFWGSFVVERPEFWAWGGDANIAIRITDGLQFTLTGWFIHQSSRVLREPLNRDRLDDVTRAALGDDFGRFVMGVNTTLSFAIGNALLRSQDQRWR